MRYYYTNITIVPHGSISKIIEPNGTVVEPTNYDTWKRVRVPQTWQYDTSERLTLIPRGYTGHEMLREFGLINMNGRVYDPLTSRFLSPDNFVQSPNNPQNYNRYSYALNNPLKYVDPDGEWVVIDDAIAFLVGGVVNLGVNLIQGNIDNAGEGVTAFIAGGAAGTLALYGPAGWTAGGL